MKTSTPKLKTGSSNDPQVTSLGERFGQSTNGSNRRAFQWADCNPTLIAEAVVKCVRSGDAIMFGRTLDGGAGVATVLSGNDRKRFYPSDGKSGDECLMQVSYAYSTVDERREFPSTFVPIGGRR
jgi:hypothetical protein